MTLNWPTCLRMMKTTVTLRTLRVPLISAGQDQIPLAAVEGVRVQN